MNWLKVFTTNTINYATGHNCFTGTLRDVWTHPIVWPKSDAQIELEKTLREEVARLQLDALERARMRGEIGEGDYWEQRARLESDCRQR